MERYSGSLQAQPSGNAAGASAEAAFAAASNTLALPASSSASGPDALAERLLRTFFDERQETCERLAEAVCARVPEYAARYVPADLVAVNMIATALFCDFAANRPLDERGAARLRAEASAAAREGIPLRAAHEAVRVARSVMSDALVMLIGRWRWDPAALTALDRVERALIDFVDLMSLHLETAYATSPQDGLERRRRAISKLYSSILTGSDAELEAAGPLLDLSAPHALFVVLAPDPERRRMMAAEFRQLRQTVVVGLADASRLALITGQARAQAGTWHRDAVAIGKRHGGVIVSAGTCGSADELRSSYRRVERVARALRYAARGKTLVHLSDLAAYELAAALPSDVRQALVSDILGSVIARPRERRENLLSTLGVVVDEAPGTTLAAQLLGVDRKTVDRRLAEVQSLTGRALDCPREAYELATAFRAHALVSNEAD